MPRQDSGELNKERNRAELRQQAQPLFYKGQWFYGDQAKEMRKKRNEEERAREIRRRNVTFWAMILLICVFMCGILYILWRLLFLTEHS